MSAAQLGFHPVYLALAIACGSKPLPWMNDSGFWVIGKMSGMTERETLTTMTVMLSITGVVGLGGDLLKDAGFERDGRDGEVFQPLRLHIAREVIEHLGGIAPQCGIAGEEAEVGIDAGGDRVVIAGAVMGIGDKLVAFTPHHGRDFGMCLVVDEAINHMRPARSRRRDWRMLAASSKRAFNSTRAVTDLPSSAASHKASTMGERLDVR